MDPRARYCADAKHHDRVLEGVNLASSCLSLCGTAAILCFYVYFGRIRHAVVDRLIFNLSLAGLAASIALVAKDAVLFSGQFSHTWCVACGICVQCFLLSQAAWTLALAVNLLVQVSSMSSSATRDRIMEIAFYVLCFGLPAAWAVALVWVDPYERTAYGWCTSSHALEALGIPLFCCYMLTAALLASVVYKLHQGMLLAGGPAAGSRRIELIALRRFALFLLPILISLTPNLTLTFMGLRGLCSPLWLVVLNNLLFPLQGFLNAVVFGLNQDIRRLLKSCCAATGYSELR